MTVCVCSSSSNTDVIVRSRNARSCDTITAPPASSSRRKRSSRSRPAKSRSLVGSSSRNTSKRASRIAASAAAAWPPDSASPFRGRARVRGARGRRARRRCGRRNRPRRARYVSSAIPYSCRRLRRVVPGGPARLTAPQCRAGSPDAGAAREIRAHALARSTFGDLGQVADVRGRRRARHAPRVGVVDARQDPQQRALPGAVGRDDADPAAGPIVTFTRSSTTWGPNDFEMSRATRPARGVDEEIDGDTTAPPGGTYRSRADGKARVCRVTTSRARIARCCARPPRFR